MPTPTAGLTPSPSPAALLAPAVGEGVNPVITRVDDSTWAALAGVAWTSACPVGRDGLRVLAVNAYGFDGSRHRGRLVLAAAAATPAALRRALRPALPDPPDASARRSWGRNPKGPGADDYASMTADNTSAFNCRYVGGAEAS